ncbi:MAG TPA: hypothetical protein VLI05_02045 [Candidatus Saccharimonadia bacterium]|nr:hypothetical protein [Candidatus Saccharimonadia bacterium]
MRLWRLYLVTILVLILQIGFIPALRPFGVVPDLALALVVSVGLAGTASAALAVAVAGGLLLDLTSGADFGLRLGLFALVALVTGLVHRAGLNLMGPVVALALVAAATLLGDLVVLANIAGTVGAWPIGELLRRLTVEIMLNLGLTLLLRPLVNWAVASDGGMVSLG